MEERVRKLEIDSALLKKDIDYIKESVEHVPAIFSKLNALEVAFSESKGESKTTWKFVSIIVTVLIAFGSSVVVIFSN